MYAGVVDFLGVATVSGVEIRVNDDRSKSKGPMRRRFRISLFRH